MVALGASSIVVHDSRAQAPAGGSAFTTRDVRWDNDGATLVGTVYVPEGAGPFPAVLLVHAAGRSTRKDWPYVNHAELFARNGIVALVYDKRGTGQSTGTFDRFPNLGELTRDALGGVAVLKSVRAVDTARLGIWGRSQGAWIVAMAAAESRDVRFVIPVAGGSVRPIEQELFVQSNWLRKAGATPEQLAEIERVSRLVWGYYATGEHQADAQAALDGLRASAWFPPLASNVSGYPRSGQLEPPQWVAEHRATDVRWQAGLLWDPANLWAKISVPVLGIFGGADEITPTVASVAALTGAAAGAGNRNVTVKVFDGAAHSLCPAFPRERLVDGCAPVPAYDSLLVAWIRSVPRD
jgi:dienelactone hydrolase